MSVDEPRLYRVSSPKRGFLFWGASSERFMRRAYGLESKDKSRTKALLHHAGIATPFGGIAQATNTSILRQFAAAGVTRVVVKPVSGSRSRDVLANVSLQHAHVHIAINPATVFMVEQFITGREMRLLTVGDAVVAAYLRIPLHVVGDGETTLDRLIDDKIATQMSNPFSAAKVRSRDSLRNYLKERGQSLDEIPDRGDKVWLEERLVGSPDDVTDCTGELTDDVIDTALKASKCLGARISGTDIIQTGTGEAFVLELNSKPGIFRHSFPLNGLTNLKVPEAILTYHFKGLGDDVCRVRRFDFLGLMRDYREKPEVEQFDARDYVDIA